MDVRVIVAWRRVPDSDAAMRDDLAAQLHTLPAVEQARISRKARVMDQWRSCTGWLLLSSLAARHPPLFLHRAPSGRPQVTTPCDSSPPPVDVSLTHDGCWVIAACATSCALFAVPRLGIDILALSRPMLARAAPGCTTTLQRAEWMKCAVTSGDWGGVVRVVRGGKEEDVSSLLLCLFTASEALCKAGVKRIDVMPLLQEAACACHAGGGGAWFKSMCTCTSTSWSRPVSAGDGVDVRVAWFRPDADHLGCMVVGVQLDGGGGAGIGIATAVEGEAAGRLPTLPVSVGVEWPSASSAV